MRSEMPIEMIVVAERQRRAMGDIDALAASISNLGLLHPVVVTSDGRLVAGQRRLEACRRLGWSVVPVTVAANVTDAFSALMAERDENTCRENLAPSEAVALGRMIEDMERPQRPQGRHVDHEVSRTHEKEGGRHPQVRDMVGQAVGMGPSTYQRAKAVVVASEDETESEVREVARQAVVEMDATGNITGAYDKVRDAREATAIVSTTDVRQRDELVRKMASDGATTDQIAQAIGLSRPGTARLCKRLGVTAHADAVVGRRHHIDPDHVVDSIVTGLDGMAYSLGLIDLGTVDQQKIQGWAAAMGTSLSAINRLYRQLKEMTKRAAG